MKFRQSSYRCKKVFKAVKLAHANKTKESITSQNLGFCDFSKIVNNIIPSLFNPNLGGLFRGSF